MAPDSPRSPRWFRAYLPNGMAGGATSPLIPLFTNQLGGSVAAVGIVAAAPSIASVPAFLLWGTWADRLHRRKPFLLIGFLGLAVSLLAMAFVRTIGGLYLANLLMGFLAAASGPIGAVLVMETAKREDWPSRFAAFSRMGGIGWITGLAVGAVWFTDAVPFTSGDAMRSLFVVAAALAFVSAALAWMWVDEPATKIDPARVRGFVDAHWRIERLHFLRSRLMHYIELRNHRGPKSPRLRRYLLASGLLFSGFAAFYAFFPIFLSQVALLSNAQIFLVYIAGHVASAVAYGRAGRWVHDRGSRRTQAYAAGVRAALFPAFFTLPLLPLGAFGLFVGFLAMHAMVGLCWSVINVSGSLLACELASPEMRGRLLGAYNAVQGFGAIAGPLVGGFVAYVGGFLAAFAIASAFVVAGIATLTLVHAGEPVGSATKAPA